MSDEGFDAKLFPNNFNGDRVSDLKVMNSGGGYYIGRSYWDEEFGFEGPYSRESGYYATAEDAQLDLEAQSFEVRDCIENNWAYETGNLEDIR